MSDIRVGLVGAGYIAGWHADALARLSGAKLAAVCDPATEAARALAAAHGATVHADLDAMLATGGLDALHILTPPHLHAPQAIAGLRAGLHVLVEKPFALSRDEAAAMADAASAAGRLLAVNHNFLALPSYSRLRRWMAQGVPGRIDSIDIRWRYPLSPLRSGPYGLWMLRSPGNLLFELGPHLMAFAEDLAGPLGDLDLRLSKPVDVPGTGLLPQAIQIRGRAGATDVTLHLSLVEGAEDRSVEVRGVAGRARLDFGADTLIMLRPNAQDIVLNPLRQELSLAAQHVREGARNAMRQLASLNRASPYALGFQGTLAAFHAAVAGRAPLPRALSAEAALTVTTGLDAARALLPAPPHREIPVSRPVQGAPILVIGGTGFIGRALVRALVMAGHPVRVASRGRASPFSDLGDAVAMVPLSMEDPAALRQAMTGCACVYHLAKAEEATWEGYLRNDVAVAERVAEAALAACVPRLVYTGTIASYDASDPSATLTERTPFGPMEDRNLYARSKALCEERLLALHRDRGLPLVIARPGIVIGPGGPLQHWGIGRWHGAGAVRIWGRGMNPLPFVLNDDVAAGLVKMASTPGIEGESFNLVGDPLLSARGYFDAIHRLTGTRLRAVPGNLTLFWAGDLLKYALKRWVLRKQGLRRPLLADWRSRAHLSRFANDHAKRRLDWQPEGDADRMARRAIDHPGLFGF